MPSTRNKKVPSKTGDTQIPLSISLNEYLNLKSKVAELEAQVQAKDELIARLQSELHALTDPGKKADAAAFRARRR